MRLATLRTLVPQEEKRHVSPDGVELLSATYLNVVLVGLRFAVGWMIVSAQLDRFHSVLFFAGPVIERCRVFTANILLGDTKGFRSKLLQKAYRA